MEAKPGLIVRSMAGRDKGGFMVVVSREKDFVFLADGKERKLGSPKKKNVRHIAVTNTVIDLQGLTDKSLRAVIRGFNEAAENGGSLKEAFPISD